MSTCGFNEAWIGRCKEPTPIDGDRCEKHRGKKCASCGQDATRSCDETMGLVCGAPLCDDCEHTTYPNGCNSGVPLPKGMKSHCGKAAQVFKPWFEDGAEEYNARQLSGIAHDAAGRK